MSELTAQEYFLARRLFSGVLAFREANGKFYCKLMIKQCRKSVNKLLKTNL